MKIFYFVRSLEGIPSCMYNIQMLKEAGFNVVPVIGRSTESLNKYFIENKMQYFDSKAKPKKNRILNLLNLTIKYRKTAKLAMKQYNKDDIIILGTADTAIAAYGIYNHTKYVLSLKELYERPIYYQIILRHLSKKSSGIICCERNRARIIKFRWKLDKLPYVISNKPFYHPKERYLKPTCSKTSDVIKLFEGNPIIIYQARHIHFTDEIINLAKGLKDANARYTLVLMGTVDNEEDIKKINDIYPYTIWTNHIPAPHHMEVTSYASIGVAIYEESSLNNLFCAPNKIFEYAGYGIPSLCNDVPGLVETIGIWHAGECVDWNSPSQITEAINNITSKYNDYSKRTLEFFESEDNLKLIKEMINEISNYNY